MAAGPTSKIHAGEDTGNRGNGDAGVARDGDYNKNEEDRPRAAKCYIRQGHRTRISADESRVEHCIYRCCGADALGSALEWRSGSGPCLRAFRSAREVGGHPRRSDRLWPGRKCSSKTRLTVLQGHRVAEPDTGQPRNVECQRHEIACARSGSVRRKPVQTALAQWTSARTPARTARPAATTHLV
jgi:hypothetical protein